MFGWLQVGLQLFSLDARNFEIGLLYWLFYKLLVCFQQDNDITKQS